MTATTAGRPHSAAAGGRFDVVAERVAAMGVAVLVLIGFTASYATLRDLAATAGGFPEWLAPVVPLSFDLGIVVLSLKVVLAARQGRPTPVLRMLVIALSAVTVVANGAASPTAAGRLLHAVPPAIFVICFETVALGARHAVLQRQSPHVAFAPPARWLLAPPTTFRAWRRHVLGVSTAGPTDAAHRDELPQEPGASPGGVSPDQQVPALAGQPLATDAGEVTPPAHQPTRLSVALAALAAEPDTTAVALASQLARAGHPVSVRTAQRIRHQAQQAATSDARPDVG